MLKLFKENKISAILSTLIILLPMLFGAILWDRLPANMTVHWGADGVADGSGTKVFVVFIMPLIMLALHILCLFFTSLDPSNKNQGKKAIGLIFWLIPMISCVISVILYGTALKIQFIQFNFEKMIIILFGVMFVVIGNYLPKIKQNSSLGIKLTWTLRNEENWNKTHRFGGKLWVAFGVILLLSSLFDAEIFITIMLIGILACAVAPMLYSYLLYRKQLKFGEYVKQAKKPLSKSQKTISTIAAVVGCLILVFVIAVMFIGDISYDIKNDSFKINASFYNDLTVRYDEIESVELVNDFNVGRRTNGFSSARLSMGIFTNDNFGAYTLYAYTGADSYVVIKSGDDVLAISGKDEADTQELYEQISKKLAQKLP